MYMILRLFYIIAFKQLNTKLKDFYFYYLCYDLLDIIYNKNYIYTNYNKVIGNVFLIYNNKRVKKLKFAFTLFLTISLIISNLSNRSKEKGKVIEQLLLTIVKFNKYFIKTGNLNLYINDILKKLNNLIRVIKVNTLRYFKYNRSFFKIENDYFKTVLIYITFKSSVFYYYKGFILIYSNNLVDYKN
ncbi:hypothetical protein B0T21DRAFT_348180 [Apiosordaria backusii]|uniref:Uncharacterized protein n=1 Tax=Apiosordaria backusii TaxID=314023 RepID=A0AA40EC55_9PEZI|nr:hypothetical protein B0T21DRAFT_348180 [Apiosordaria backusii]